MLTNPIWWITVGILLFLILLMRIILRLSSQWQVLRKNWTWKDELMDSAFYFIILISVATVVFQVISYVGL